MDQLDSSRIDRAFGAWATRSLESRAERAERCALLSNLMRRSSSPRGSAPAPTRAVPAAFARLVESQVRLRHAAARSCSNTGVVYTLPWWLAWGTRFRSMGPQGLRVHLEEDGFRIRVEDACTLKAVSQWRVGAALLRPQRPSARRRRLLAATASALLHGLEVVTGRTPLASRWLARSVTDPSAAEREALTIWGRFVEDCNVPSSFRGGRLGLRAPLRLGELLLLRSGAKGGRHRHAFAQQQPWATRELLKRPGCEEALVLIDEHPAAGIHVAARELCCSVGDEPCEAAVEFARRMPRHRARPHIDKLLGSGHRSDAKKRAILLKAASEDGHELLRHIEGAPLARAQVATACDVANWYEAALGSVSTALGIAALLFRMMIRDTFVPRDVDAYGVAVGLATVAADSLAAHVAARQPESRDDRIDVALDALVAYFGHTRRPLLTAKQFVRFAEAAGQRGVHGDGGSNWPVPLGWSPRKHLELEGAIIKPLTRRQDLSAEGRQMRNCLARGYGFERALVGDVAFFSIQASDGARATAMLTAVQSVGTLELKGWRVEQVLGPNNEAATDPCLSAVGSLVTAMNEACPLNVPDAELMRRQRLDGRERTFNANMAAAETRWFEIYVPLLPRRMATLSPGEVVSAYLAKQEAVRVVEP